MAQKISVKPNIRTCGVCQNQPCACSHTSSASECRSAEHPTHRDGEVLGLVFFSRLGELTREVLETLGVIALRFG